MTEPNKNEKAMGVLAIVLAPLLILIYATTWASKTWKSIFGK